jgi:hypothetical protein
MQIHKLVVETMQSFKVLVPNEDETCNESISSMFGAIILNNTPSVS